METTENELRLIGSMLVDKEVIWKVINLVKPLDFKDDRLAKIYSAMVYIVNCGNTPNIDAVIAELEIRNQLEHITRTYIFNLIADITTGCNATLYANNVVKYSRYRRLKKAAENILNMEYSDDIYETAMSMIYETSKPPEGYGLKNMKEVANDILESMNTSNNRIMTGFSELDMITGGFRPSQMITIAARTGVGKTALATTIMANMCTNGNKVAFFSLEMDNNSIYRRLMSLKSGIPLYKIQDIDNVNKQISTVFAELAETPNLYLCDKANAGIHTIESELMRMKQLYGLDIAFIDYLQLIENSNYKISRYEQVSQISRKIKLLAKNLQIPIVALSQLSRSAADSDPKIHHLKESGAIEQDSDIVLLLIREAADISKLENICLEDRAKTQLQIAKHRNGPQGIINLIYRNKILKFDDEINIKTNK